MFAIAPLSRWSACDYLRALRVEIKGPYQKYLLETKYRIRDHEKLG